MPIRPLAPSHCPNCNKERTLFIRRDAFECRFCGYRQPLSDKPPKLTKAPASDVEERRAKLHASYAVSHPGPIERWARVKFDSAQDAVYRKDWDAALKSLYQSLEYQSDFLDAHLWIARISADDDERREHLEYVLAVMPNHVEAIRELMVLNGQITREEAERAATSDGPVLQHASAPVAADIATPNCPECGGMMEEVNGRLVCSHCGYQASANARTVGDNSLTMALVEKRGKAVNWVVGEHMLECQYCGALHIQSHKLSTECPFCGSVQIVKQDALDSLQQPDGMLPFAITQTQAEAALEAKLGGWQERLKGFFTANRPDQIRWQSAYLPFWIFDALVHIRRTTYERNPRQNRYMGQIYQTEELADSFTKLPIPAVKSPHPKLLKKLQPWDFDKLVPYDLRRLSKHVAELYTIDFDKASLDARSVISEIARWKHGQSSDENVTVNIFPMIQHMSFRLVLLPLWIANITEEDGDKRLGLVNGQTGQTVLGKAVKIK